MSYSARIIADSISENDCRLTTLEVVFPRIVLSEFNTPRVFTRNSASSRAIPIEKQLAKVKNDPFIPVYWGAAQKGMQAAQEIGLVDQVRSQNDWLKARDAMIEFVEKMLERGLHKQIPNRLLEPFNWQTVLVSSTEWRNFWALRISEDAQPEIRVAAEFMKDAYDLSTPALLGEGEWHLPLIQPDEMEWAKDNVSQAVQVSSARSGRVSYETHAGVRDISEDLKMYRRLVEPGHMSPLEHPARPFSKDEWKARKNAMVSISTSARKGLIDERTAMQIRIGLEFEGNYRGFHQHRKDVTYEHDYSLMKKE